MTDYYKKYLKYKLKYTLRKQEAELTKHHSDGLEVIKLRAAQREITDSHRQYYERSKKVEKNRATQRTIEEAEEDKVAEEIKQLQTSPEELRLQHQRKLEKEREERQHQKKLRREEHQRQKKEQEELRQIRESKAQELLEYQKESTLESRREREQMYKDAFESDHPSASGLQERIPIRVNK